MTRDLCFRRLVLATALLGLLAPGRSQAEAGDGSFSVTHQYISYRRFAMGNGEEAFTGKVDSQSVTFGLSYDLTDRLEVGVSLPFVARRYRGPYPHGLEGLDAERGAEFVDDGSYNTDFQDFTVSFSYAAGWGDRLVGGPVLEIQAPSHDYPIYGSAVVGIGVWRVGLGATVGAQFEASNNYWSAAYSYVFSEKVDSVDLNHHRFTLEWGRFLSPAWTARLFLVGKYGGGLDFYCDKDGLVPRFDRCGEDDYPSFSDRRWYLHDQTMSGEFVNAGFGVDWAFSDAYQTSVSYMTGLWERNSYVTGHALTVGLTRLF